MASHRPRKDIYQKPRNLPTARFNSNCVLFEDVLVPSEKHGYSYDLLYDLSFGIRPGSAFKNIFAELELKVSVSHPPPPKSVRKICDFFLTWN